METEKMKNEIEKIARKIYKKLGEDITKQIVMADEASASSYHVRISGESIDDMTVSLVQNGNWGASEKYELEISCVPLGDYVDFSVPDTDEGYFASARESDDLKDDIISNLQDQLEDYAPYIEMDKKIIEYIKESPEPKISDRGHEIAELSFNNKDDWSWEDWDFLYGNNSDNFPEDELLEYDDEDFGEIRYKAIKEYVNNVFQNYFEVE